MLLEIESSKFKKALPLLSGEPPGFMMALPILKGIRAGRVFVDDSIEPKCAFVLSSSGWHVAIGHFENAMLPQISELSFGRAGMMENDFYNIRVSRVAMVGRHLELSFPAKGKSVEREMRVLMASRENKLPPVSDNRIQELDSAGFEQASQFIPMLPIYWPDKSKLLGQGMAKAFIENGKVKGVCYTCLYAGDLHEPHVTVDEPYRGQGIGKMITQAYTQSLLKSGKRIFWSHYTDNELSGRCAETAGYRPYGLLKVIQYIESK